MRLVVRILKIVLFPVVVLLFVAIPWLLVPLIAGWGKFWDRHELARQWPFLRKRKTETVQRPLDFSESVRTITELAEFEPGEPDEKA